MKKVLLVLFSLYNFLLSQSNIAVKFNGKTMILNFELEKPRFFEEKKGTFTVRDYYEFTDPFNAGSYKLPTKDLIIAIPPKTTPKINVSFIQSSVINQCIPKVNPAAQEENSSIILKNIDIPIRANSLLTENNFEFKGYLWIGNYYCLHIKIPLVSFDENFSRITEYNRVKIEFIFNNEVNIISSSPIIATNIFEEELYRVIINKESAGLFSGNPVFVPNDSTGNWFNYNSTYVKLSTAQDGLYRIKKSDLENIGINTTQINPKQFQLFESGKEEAIYVFGEEDGVFDQNDYIEFYGHKNYSKISARIINSIGKPYNEYLNKYTDSTIYFLTWGNTNGKRVSVNNNFITGLTDTLNYYNHFEHVEENLMYQPVSLDVVNNQDPEYQTGKSWFKTWVDTNPQNYLFTTKDILTNYPAGIFCKMISQASNRVTQSHNITLSVNANLIDSMVANRNDIIVIGKYFSGNLLIDGLNYFTIHNQPNGTTTNQLVWDWYEVEYHRKLKALNDSLIFKFTDSLYLKERIIKIENIQTSNVLIYRLTPSLKKIENFQFSNNTIYFSDSVGTNYSYILSTPARIFSPVFNYKKKFVNLRNTSKSAIYIGITHPLLFQSATNYINFISSAYNIKTELVLTEDIFDEFAFGYPTAEAIKYFLKIASQYWTTPKPKYLSLLGSACYDYKRIFYKLNGTELNQNLVPSFGEPVSDTWFTMFDSTSALIQQMLVGRIPARNSTELNNYLTKHKNYLNQRINKFNKTAIFFSGGDSNDSTQLKQLKSVNDYIVNNFARPAPFSMSINHFYKTVKPLTDFGPFDMSFVRNTIDEGALFISYIGHSGTRTWDNSISEPYQLYNKYNRGSLISDFGCSTNKFAEPDVEAFGELFINDGQAIGYVGNSSLGFTSTSTTVPIYFYESALKDTIRELGAIHFSSKQKMFSRLGTTGTYRVCALTNLLCGDPILNLGIYTLPNLNIAPADVDLINKLLNDQTDSAEISIGYNNWGSVKTDSFSILIEDWQNNQKIFSTFINRLLPSLYDEFKIKIPVKDKPGEHTLKIILDPQNIMNEIYEDDNNIDYRYTVPTLSLRLMQYNPFTSQSNANFKILGQTNFVNLISQEIILECDTSEYFLSSKIFKYNIDTLMTDITIPNLTNNTRYWIRARLNSYDTLWSQPMTFLKSSEDYKFTLSDFYSFNKQYLDNLSSTDKVVINIDTIFIGIKSGGGNVSKFGTVTKNGVNVLPNTFTWGMGMAVFDSSTFKVDTSQTFWYGDTPKNADSLASLINRTPNGKIIALCVIDDGWLGMQPNLSAAIKSLGSTLIDSLYFRTPWLLLCRKGAVNPVIKEILMPNTYPEILSFDTSFVKNGDTGFLLTSAITNSSQWRSLKANYSEPNSSSIRFKIIGIKENNLLDSLGHLSIVNGSCDLSFINANTYPSIKLVSEFNAGENGTSPILNSLKIDYTGLPELAINYQCVSFSKDTFQVGEEAKLDFFIQNIGETDADSFIVNVETIYPDNKRDLITTHVVNKVKAGEKEYFSTTFTFPIGDKQRRLLISVNSSFSIKELYYDNNFFSIPYIVNPDTAKPSLKITFDDREILDGDYISNNPKIKIALYSTSLIPITNKNSVKLFLNETPVQLVDSNYEFNSSNPKVVVTYFPKLQAGNYTLTVFAKDSSGLQVDTAGSSKNFVVDDKTKLLNVFNFPNPFKNETYFTFKLTQVPEKLEIKIFTVAGRLVKQISRNSNELNTDFNRIYWDGRDEDGNPLANGTYFYKLIIKQNNKSEVKTNKIVILR